MIGAVLLVLAIGGLIAAASNKKPEPAKPKPLSKPTSQLYLPPPKEPEDPWTMKLKPGVEAFSQEPLPEGQRFKVLLEGSYSFQAHTRRPSTSQNVTIRADACYETEEDSANYTQRYAEARLFFDLQPVLTNPFEENRAGHAYTFAYTGTGKKLSVLLTPSRTAADNLSHLSGTLTVRMSPLSSEEEAVAQSQAHAWHEEQARKKAEERAAKQRETEKQHQARMRELTARYELCPYFAEETFLAQYAEKHRAELVEQRDTIVQEYVDLCSDTAYTTYLKEHAGQHLVNFSAWKARALALANKLDVETPAPPPKKKRTADEIRAIKLRHQQAQIGDKISLTKGKIEAILKVRQDMDQYDDLDPDERQQIESELIESILDTEQGSASHGKDI